MIPHLTKPSPKEKEDIIVLGNIKLQKEEIFYFIIIILIHSFNSTSWAQCDGQWVDNFGGNL